MKTEIETILQIGNNNKNLFRIIKTEKESCFGCYGYGKFNVCKKLPDCCGNNIFKKLAAAEVRKLLKNKDLKILILE